MSSGHVLARPRRGAPRSSTRSRRRGGLPSAEARAAAARRRPRAAPRAQRASTPAHLLGARGPRHQRGHDAVDRVRGQRRRRRAAVLAPDDVGERVVRARAWRRPRVRPRCRRAAGARRAGSPRRRPDATAGACPGFMIESGSNTRRSRAMKLRSASANCSGRLCALSSPTPCSPVTLPPSAQAGAQQLLVGLLGALELAGHAVVVADQRVEVAVAGVEHVGDDAAGAARRWPAISRMICGQLRARHHRVLQQPVGREAPDDARRLLAPLPEQRALRLVRATRISSASVLAADRHDRARPGPRSPRAGPSSSISSTAPAPLG